MDGKDRRGSAGNREARREIFLTFFLNGSGNTAAGKSRRRRSNRSRIEREGSRMSGQQFSRKWLAGAFGVGGYAVARAKDAVSTSHVRASLKLADPSEGPSKTGFAPVVKEVLPNVVNISSSKVVKARNQMQMPEGMEQDPFFQQFFGQQFGGRGRGGNGNGPDQQPQKQREQSLGSGVIVSPEGYILTNNHVVDGATDVKVTLSDKRELKAKIVGTDPKTDVAVLKLAGEKFNAITLGDSTKVNVGDYALAIGDPFGVGR